jgi:alpha/beta superfamily hydrolase
MVERRKSDRRSIVCQAHNPVCMTIGFMFGMIVGSLIHTEHSVLNVVLSVSLATTVFHFTFVRNVNFLDLFSKVIKKGS